MTLKTRRRIGWASPAAVALAIIAAAPAHAGTINVTTTVDQLNAAAPCSLREAVRFANDDTTAGGCADTDNAAADLIQLSAGDHNLTIAGVEDANASGDLDVTDNVTIQGVGGATGIDGNDLDRVLQTPTGATINLSALTVHDGAATNDGGGLRLNNATLTDVTVVDNTTTGQGGGIDAGPVVSLIDSTVSDNTAGTNGGGVAAPTVNLTRSTVISNTSGNSAPGPGGGISGAGTITDSTVSGNRALSGSNGAGIATATGNLTVLRSTIAANDATPGNHGGGVSFTSTGTFNLTNSTISGNLANNHGGGIYQTAGTVGLVNATITQNVTDTNFGTIGSGGGIRVEAPGVATLRNTIVAGNTANGVIPEEDCSGTVTSQGYNLFGVVAGCTIGGETTGNIVNPAPGLGPLANNGGPTATHAVLGGSPALNAGYPGSGAGIPCEPTDQRALPRGGAAGICDIGAFEVQGTGAAPGGTPLVPAATSTPTPGSTAKKCKKGRKLKKGKCVRKKRRK